jgi:FtsZ-interacting cell division protein ZipA
MKKIQITLIIVGILAVIELGLVISLWIDMTKSPKIDYPEEEWKAISTDPSKPDTCISYRSRDTVFFKFK